MVSLETCTSIQRWLSVAKAPLETLGLENEYDILVKAHGGGLTGQSDSIRLGVARALCQLDPDNRSPLKIEGYLTRPTGEERKKYGLHKARRHLSSLSVRSFRLRFQVW